MAQVLGPQKPILLHDGLQAGFLLSTRLTRREHAAFSKDERNGSITYVRHCTKGERTTLNKMIFGEKKVHSLKGLTKDGKSCNLFVAK